MEALDRRQRSLVLVGLSLVAGGLLLQLNAPGGGESVGPVRVSVLISDPEALPLFNGTLDLPVGQTTALHALRGAAEQANLTLDVTEQYGDPFVVQIAEYRNEGLSGWCYEVNDRWADRSAGRFELQAGDRVRWYWAPRGCEP